MRHCCLRLLLALAMLSLAPPAFPQTDREVNAQIGVLQQRLFRDQQRDGSWQGGGYTVGATALCTLALVHSGVPTDDERLVRAFNYLDQHSEQKTYSEGLVACVFELVGRKEYRRRIRQAVEFLEEAQTPEGNWSYQKGRNSGDNSNTQFAVLGLAAAERAGVRVSAEVKRQAVNYWTSTQNGDGGWGYTGRAGTTFNMTCAGIASLSLLGVEHERKERCCGRYRYDRNLAAALDRLPRLARDQRQRRGNYGLYAAERVGMFLGLQRIGGWDWYKEGCAEILRQNANQNLSDAAFALLFLAKGSAPIAVAKWQWSGDWNNQHHDARNWVEYSGEILDRRFDWLSATIGPLDSPAAKASIIYVNGRDVFRATPREIDFLRSFLEEGGTLVAEATCDSQKFRTSFGAIMARELYPEYQAKFVAIDEGHPLLTAHYDLTPAELGAYKLECGCRQVKVIFLERGISCSLNGDLDRRADRPRAHKVATNLLVWALADKNADKKLDRTTLKLAKAKEAITPDQLRRLAAQQAREYAQPLGRLRHGTDWYFAPTFFPNYRRLAALRDDVAQFDGEVYVKPNSNDLYQSAVVFMTGHQAPKLGDRDWLHLRNYLQNGGFLLASAACSSKQFDLGFRALMANVLPNDKLEEIPRDDPLRQSPFDLSKGQPSTTKAYAARFGDDWAPLYGVRREGRWIVVYCPADLCSDIAEGIHEAVPGYKRDTAFKTIANITGYAFTP